jgi:hypothetical protein
MATPCHTPFGLDGVKFRWLKVLLFQRTYAQLDRKNKKKRRKLLEDADAWEWR